MAVTCVGLAQRAVRLEISSKACKTFATITKEAEMGVRKIQRSVSSTSFTASQPEHRWLQA